MRQITLAGLRANTSRLIAVSIAVLLAVAFMSATLLLSSSSQATLRSTLGAEFQHADLVVESHTSDFDGFELSSDIASEIRKVPGVETVDGRRGTGVAVASDTRQEPFGYVQTLMDPALDPTALAEGRLPETEDEVVLSEAALGLLEVELGDTLTFSSPGGPEWDPVRVEIVGISEPSLDPFRGGQVAIFITDASFEALTALSGQPSDSYYQLLVKLSDGADLDDVEQAITAYGPVVNTPEEIVADLINSFTDGTNVLTAVLLAFVGIALFVAGLVIANTFSVLVAQRTRELALLRCIGASTRQVYRSVIVEAFVMSLIASVLGVALAVGIMAGLIWVAGELNIAGGIGVFAMNWHAIVWPILTGVVVTLIAANGPAREATRVAPLEALRVRGTESLTRGGGLARLISGVVLLVAGVALIVFAMGIDDSVSALGLALLGSVVSAVGVLLLMVFIIPPMAYAFGRIGFSARVPGRIAALNSIRNPKRTAATASALLIGVTLVATVYTGAEVARATLAQELASSFPVDLVVTKPASIDFVGDSEETLEEVVQPNPITEAELSRIRALDGIVGVAEASDLAIEYEPNTDVSQVWGVEPDAYALVTRDPEANLEPGTAFIGHDVVVSEVTFTGEHDSVTVSVAEMGAPFGTAILALEDLERLGTNHGTHLALIKVSDGLSSADILELRDELAAIVPEGYVTGEGVERAMFDEIIQMLLLIVTALLAVAIIIAVIGIANTLALSVIERTRENALMRALGLTRGQLRWMLAVEAILIAFTAAIFGVVLGVFYGFAGATTILGSVGKVVYGVPWLALGIILIAALLAGLAASVLPARRAAKLSPVAALQHV